MPTLPLNQSTDSADDPVYRQPQVVRIGNLTFPSVVDLKFGVTVLADLFARVGISDRIETERAFHRGFFWVNSKTFFPVGICFI